MPAYPFGLSSGAVKRAKVFPVISMAVDLMCVTFFTIVSIVFKNHNDRTAKQHVAQFKPKTQSIWGIV